jgi:hypothetical protein
VARKELIFRGGEKAVSS